MGENFSGKIPEGKQDCVLFMQSCCYLLHTKELHRKDTVLLYFTVYSAARSGCFFVFYLARRKMIHVIKKERKISPSVTSMGINMSLTAAK